MAVQGGAKRQGLDGEGVRDAFVFEGVDDRVGDAEVREGLLVEVLALAGDVRGGLFDLGGCGLDVAEADDACGVFDDRALSGAGKLVRAYVLCLKNATGLPVVTFQCNGV